MPTVPLVDPDLPRQKWFRLRKAAVWIFWSLICLSVATVIWALIYVNDKGFTRKWRRMVITELARRGVYTQISRLTLNPVQGLVARDVELLDPRDQRRVLAKINELVLDIDYSGLVHGRQFLRSMDLYNAQIALPLDPDSRKSDVLDIVGLNATVRLPPNKVEFDAEAVVHGLRVKASGRLANPTALRSALARERADSRTIRGHQFLRFLDRLEITGGNPLLELHVDGDLAQPEQIHAKATLHSGPFTVAHSYRVKSARLHLAYNGDGLLRLNQCVLSDRLGELDAAGMVEVQDGRAVFRLNSSIDLQGLLHSLHISKKVDEFAFYSPPLLEVSGEVTLRQTKEEEQRETSLFPVEGKIMGSFSVGRFMARSVMFEGAGGEFSWDGERWFLRDGRLTHRSGQLAASLLRTPENFRFRLESNLAPKIVYPLLPGSVAEAMSEWEFPDAPQIRVHGEALPGWKGLKGEGELTLGATKFRGLPMKALHTRIGLEGSTLTFDDFRLDRAEGKAVGKVSVNLDKRVITFHEVHSTLRPQELAVWIDKRGDLPRNLAPYRFRKPPALKLDGSVQIHGDEFTKLRIDVDGHELDYHFITRDLYFPNIRGTLWLIEHRLKIEDLVGEVFGGKIYGSADISIDPKKGDYHGEGRAESIDFPGLTEHYLNYKESKGRLSGTYAFEGRGHEVRNLSGRGSVMVQDGNVFAIPLFGPFSGILNTILPGTGYNNARKASATFTMGKGVVETSDLEIEGKGFSMYGGGKLFFLEDKIDFGIRINAQGAAGFVLTPVSHLFEYVSDETLSKPVWRPKRLPKGFFGSSKSKATPAAATPPQRPPRIERARP